MRVTTAAAGTSCEVEAPAQAVHLGALDSEGAGQHAEGGPSAREPHLGSPAPCLLVPTSLGGMPWKEVPTLVPALDPTTSHPAP